MCKNNALINDLPEDYLDFPPPTQADLGLSDEDYASYMAQGEGEEEFSDLVSRIGIDAALALPSRIYCRPDGKGGPLELIETYADGTASVIACLPKIVNIGHTRPFFRRPMQHVYYPVTVGEVGRAAHL